MYAFIDSDDINKVFEILDTRKIKEITAEYPPNTVVFEHEKDALQADIPYTICVNTKIPYIRGGVKVWFKPQPDRHVSFDNLWESLMVGYLTLYLPIQSQPELDIITLLNDPSKVSDYLPNRKLKLFYEPYGRGCVVFIASELDNNITLATMPLNKVESFINKLK